MAEAEGLREKVLELMRAPGFLPRNKGELARDLELHPDQRADLRAELATMEREGVIVRGKKARYQLRENEGNLLSGTIRFQPKGDAWFDPDSAKDDLLSILQTPPPVELQAWQRRVRASNPSPQRQQTKTQKSS